MYSMLGLLLEEVTIGKVSGIRLFGNGQLYLRGRFS